MLLFHPMGPHSSRCISAITGFNRRSKRRCIPHDQVSTCPFRMLFRSNKFGLAFPVEQQFGPKNWVSQKAVYAIVTAFPRRILRVTQRSFDTAIVIPGKNKGWFTTYFFLPYLRLISSERWNCIIPYVEQKNMC